MSSANLNEKGGKNLGSRRSRKGRSLIRNRPFVVATFAMTADGKVTTKNFGPVDFTSREDKLHLFRQRALADAVLLGHTSLERDNVRLGLPVELQELRMKCGQSRSPLRVIVSNKGRIDDQLKIFQSDISPIIIFSTKRMPSKNQKALGKTATLHLTNAREVDLAAMLKILRNQYKVRTLACEGGPTLFRALLGTGVKRTLGRIGMVASEGFTPISVGQAFGEAWNLTVDNGSKIFAALGALVHGVGVSDLGGPIAIAQVSVQAARGGIETLLLLIALISINVAVFNLLPIPILDGGQILLNVAETIKGSAFSTQTRERILKGGLLIIGLLFVTVMFNDISRNMQNILRLLGKLFGRSA